MASLLVAKKSAVLAPGAHVLIRDAAWRIVKINPTSTGHQALYVVGLDEIVRGKEAVFLTEYEREVRLLRPEDTALVRDTTSNHMGSLLYMESLLRRIPPTDAAIHVGHRAAMDLNNYQLIPAAKALAQPRQRILIADSVGLGKTLEAGILLSELIARGRGQRILVVGVKSLLTQLQREFWSRFAIGLVRLDSIGLQRVRNRIPTNHNPFHHYDRAIISIDTLKQDRAYSHYLRGARWDIIVIDEAHNVAHRGSGRSQRARLADLLATRSDTLIMLSATPHDGNPRSFASLMNMLDATAIADEKAFEKAEIDHLLVRRFFKDVRADLEKHIPPRDMDKVVTQASEAEEAAFDALSNLQFTALDQRRGGHMLFRTTLEKALLSSPAACLKTIKGRIDRLQKHKNADRYTADIASLQVLAARLDAITPESFAKYQRLLALLRTDWRWKPKKDDRLVIFTERIETMRFVAAQLSKDLGLSWSRKKPDMHKDQILTLDGSMSDVDQAALVDAFGNAKAKVRVLVASDVASEGINLHHRCHRLVHFDVPWSLMLFQQRNGRIDRYGQTKPPLIRYMLTDADNDRFKTDMHVLAKLTEKDERVRENIGDPSALTGHHSVEDEEAEVASHIEAGTPDDLFAMIDLDDLDALTLELTQHDDTEAERGVDTQEPLSLFEDDFDYLRRALEVVRSERGLTFTLDEANRQLDLTLPADLKRWLRRLPQEAMPEDDHLLLCADVDRLKDSISAARERASSWPALHYLWRLHPVFDWIGDKASGQFGRHSAPILFADRAIGPDEVCFVMSGLIPNRRSQPMIHRWFAATFKGPDLTAIEDFQALAQRLELGQRPIPNAEDELCDESAVQALLPMAVAAVTDRMRALCKDFEAEMRPRLDAEIAKLQALQESRQAVLKLRLDEDVLKEEVSETQRRAARAFTDYRDWVKEVMTLEDTPFVQVIAAIVPSRYLQGA